MHEPFNLTSAIILWAFLIILVGGFFIYSVVSQRKREKKYENRYKASKPPRIVEMKLDEIEDCLTGDINSEHRSLRRSVQQQQY